MRSSYYLEDVATEFDVQGLELDWACITWDADFRYARSGWTHKSFVATGGTLSRMRIGKNSKERLSRSLDPARQGMVIVVPAGDRGRSHSRPGLLRSDL